MLFSENKLSDREESSRTKYYCIRSKLTDKNFLRFPLRKTETNLRYSNIEDFDEVIVSSLWQNRGYLLLLKESTLLKSHL